MTEAPPKPRTILIIDDDLSWHDFARRVLEHKYTLLGARDGAEGLEMAAAHKPDLIVLDIMMPGRWDGFSVLCELRKRAETSGVPVVLMSEINAIMDLEFSPDVVQAQLGHRPAAFLEKPVEIGQFRDAVDRLLDADA